jgi:hypothetical protein
MSNPSWVHEFPGEVTVCDQDGTILEMNAFSVRYFAADGGSDLIGKNLLDCHPDYARSRLKELLANQQRNVYTIEKEGIKRLIYQTPWYADGKFQGLVELSLEIPEEIPHFKRSS